MKSQYVESYYDMIEDRIVKKQAIKTKEKYLRKPSLAVQQFVKAQDDRQTSFEFTYKAGRHEQGWLLDSLGYFYEHQWISDVLRMAKGGKEASVYLCRGGTAVNDRLLAAKVSRPRMLRNLKNDQLYREGRPELDENGKQILDLGMLKAEHKRSVYGEAIRHQSWISYEFETLKKLYAAGADVPQPYEMASNAILMDFIGDELESAPTLNTVELDFTEAKRLFERIVHNINLMLKNDRIHGDLSAYNVLYWDGRITLIDFPQVVIPGGNPNAFRIFLRDVNRICEYFASQGIVSYPRRLAERLWTAHGHRLTPEIHPAHLDPDDPRDYEAWKRQK